MGAFSFIICCENESCLYISTGPLPPTFPHRSRSTLVRNPSCGPLLYHSICLFSVQSFIVLFYFLCYVYENKKTAKMFLDACLRLEPVQRVTHNTHIHTEHNLWRNALICRCYVWSYNALLSKWKIDSRLV